MLCLRVFVGAPGAPEVGLLAAWGLGAVTWFIIQGWRCLLFQRAMRNGRNVPRTATHIIPSLGFRLPTGSIVPLAGAGIGRRIALAGGARATLRIKGAVIEILDVEDDDSVRYRVVQAIPMHVDQIMLQIIDFGVFAFVIISMVEFYRCMYLSRTSSDVAGRERYSKRYHLIALLGVALVLSYLSLRTGVNWLNSPA